MSEKNTILLFFESLIGKGKRFPNKFVMAEYLGLTEPEVPKLYRFLKGADTQYRTVLLWLEKLGAFIVAPGLSAQYPSAAEHKDIAGLKDALSGAKDEIIRLLKENNKLEKDINSLRYMLSPEQRREYELGKIRREDSRAAREDVDAYSAEGVPVQENKAPYRADK